MGRGPGVADPPQGTDRWSAPFSAGALGDPARPGSRTDTDCFEWEHGLVDADMFYVACIGNGNGAVRVERYDLTGTEIDRAEVGRFTGFGAFAARPDHRLFLWDPQSHTLMSYDLQTGQSGSLKVPDTAVLESPSDILSAIGRTVGSWLAPTTTAKILLQPAIAVSADGTRLYALGIEATPSELGGSAGVFAFDISGDTLALVGHWPANADYVSLAVSEDGAFVYAAGMGGVDADGLEAPGVKPSITVFDATDGSSAWSPGSSTATNCCSSPRSSDRPGAPPPRPARRPGDRGPGRVGLWVGAGPSSRAVGGERPAASASGAPADRPRRRPPTSDRRRWRPAGARGDPDRSRVAVGSHRLRRLRGHLHGAAGRIRSSGRDRSPRLRVRRRLVAGRPSIVYRDSRVASTRTTRSTSSMPTAPARRT